jgi:hypothetical protein
VIYVYCDGRDGRHLSRRRIYPLWLASGRVIIYCQPCGYRYVTKRERWEQVQAFMEQTGLREVKITDIVGGLEVRER